MDNVQHHAERWHGFIRCYLHAHRYRQLHSGKQLRKRNGKQSYASDHLGYAGSHYPWRSAKFYAVECHGERGGQFCLHSGSGRYPERGNKHVPGDLYTYRCD